MAKAKAKKGNTTSDADERETIKTPIFRCTYLGLPDVVKRKNKDTGEQENQEQYQVTAMFEDGTNLKELDKLALKTLRAQFGKKAEAEDYAMPLLDGNKRARKKGQSLFEDSRYCNMKSNWPFVWLDVDGNEIDLSDKSELYAGIYARAVISAYSYTSDSNEGVSFNIVTMQKIRDGEEIAMGGVNKEQARELFDDDVAATEKAKNKKNKGKGKGKKGKGKGKKGKGKKK